MKTEWRNEAVAADPEGWAVGPKQAEKVFDEAGKHLSPVE